MKKIIVFLLFSICIYGCSSNNTPEPIKTIYNKNTSNKLNIEDKQFHEKKIVNNGKIVVIDPGHQASGNNEQEPIGPGASETKPKVTTGTTGINSRTLESVIALSISFKLKSELEARGYSVIMTRTDQNVNLSNKERADIANNSGGDIFIRIHCNGSENKSTNGALTMAPTVNNPYCPEIINSSAKLSIDVLNGLCNTTGAANKGVSYTDSMSGINWCKIPVTIVEAGFLSNPNEDALLNSEDYQNKIAAGIADGVDTYFK